MIVIIIFLIPLYPKIKGIKNMNIIEAMKKPNINMAIIYNNVAIIVSINFFDWMLAKLLKDNSKGLNSPFVIIIMALIIEKKIRAYKITLGNLTAAYG